MSITIITAVYGTETKKKDVKSICQELVKNNNRIYVNNSSMGGDPDYGARKKLTLVYKSNGGGVFTKSCLDGGFMDLT